MHVLRTEHLALTTMLFPGEGHLSCSQPFSGSYTSLGSGLMDGLFPIQVDILVGVILV